MAWYGWLLLAVSLAGCVLWWRIVVRYLINDDLEDDWFGATFLGLLVAAFWPLALVVWVFVKLRGPQAVQWFVMGAVGRTPVAQQRTATERETRIAKLERELGIDQ